MANVSIAGLDGENHAVPSREMAILADRVGGEVLYPGAKGYQEATVLWNGMIRKRPAVVVRPADTGDVVHVVDFARERGLQLSIRGGGHNIAGLALCDGGITLDMSRLKRVAVDADARLVDVGPGCTLGDVDRETQRHGLATTLGFVSETGVAGLTLGGGVGYLTRRFGWTVDDLDAVEIVTADGAVRKASRSENAELFWALRGGGGNFGVVTRFVFRLHPVGPEITGGLIAWPATETRDVLELYRRVTEDAPRELTVVTVSRNAPPAPWLAEEHHGKPMVAFVVCHTGDPDQAKRDLAPIRDFGTPWADIIGVKEYAAQQSMLDAIHPKGLGYYWKSEYLDRISDEFMGKYVRALDDNDSPANQIVLFHTEGALNEHPEDDGAVGNRDAAYICLVQGLWPVESDLGDDYRAWVRRVWSELKPFTTGGNYINFHNTDDDLERTKAAYRGNYGRLAEAKSAYDPQNLFQVNRNIPPASSPARTAKFQHART